MADDVRQNRTDERGGNVLTLDGRDPARTNRIMSELWAHAMKINLEPVRWRIGFFNLRDVLAGRDPHFSGRPYSAVRLESLWGCTIEVVSFFDTIELVAFDKGAPSDQAYRTLVPSEPL